MGLSNYCCRCLSGLLPNCPFPHLIGSSHFNIVKQTNNFFFAKNIKYLAVFNNWPESIAKKERNMVVIQLTIPFQNLTIQLKRKCLTRLPLPQNLINRKREILFWKRKGLFGSCSIYLEASPHYHKVHVAHNL